MTRARPTGLGFRRYRDQVKAARIANDYYAVSAGKDPFPGLDMDAVHKQRKPRAAPVQREAPVVAAIAELLAAHPKVLFAVRQNSGMASYEAKSGRYAPVYFYKILTHGRAHGNLTLPDFWGFLRDHRAFAVEAKAPGWNHPRDERERRQENFLALVRSVGGIGIFATDAAQVAAALA